MKVICEKNNDPDCNRFCEHSIFHEKNSMCDFKCNSIKSFTKCIEIEIEFIEEKEMEL